MISVFRIGLSPCHRLRVVSVLALQVGQGTDEEAHIDATTLLLLLWTGDRGGGQAMNVQRGEDEDNSYLVVARHMNPVNLCTWRPPWHSILL